MGTLNFTISLGEQDLPQHAYDISDGISDKWRRLFQAILAMKAWKVSRIWSYVVPDVSQVCNRILVLDVLMLCFPRVSNLNNS